MIFLSCHFWFLRLRGVLATIDWGTALYGERSKKLRRTTRILQRGQSEWRCKAHTGFERDRRDANLEVWEFCLRSRSALPGIPAFGVCPGRATFRACWTGGFREPSSLFTDIAIQRFLFFCGSACALSQSIETPRACNTS